MDGYGALLGLIGCIVAGALCLIHDFAAAGCILVISMVLFGAERLFRR